MVIEMVIEMNVEINIEILLLTFFVFSTNSCFN